MKFLIVTQYYPPEIGASQVRLAAVARELKSCGQEVEVVSALPNHPTGTIFPSYRRRFYFKEEIEGITVHRTWLYAATGAGFRRIINYGTFAVTSLFGLLHSKVPDYIFVESPPPFLMINAFILARRWKAKIILNVADLWPDSARELGLLQNSLLIRLAENFERWSYSVAYRINAVTEGISSTLMSRKGVPEEKILFLPNGVDTKLFNIRPPDLELADNLGVRGKNVILYAGTHGYAHGLEYILDAAKNLMRRKDIHFLFIGDGSEKKSLIKRATDYGLINVTFLGPVPLKEMPRYLSISAIGLVPQRGLKLFEGNRPSKLFPIMACGVPLLFIGHGESERIVKEAGGGVTVPPENPEAIARAIELLVDNPQMSKKLGHNGRAFVEQHFGWSTLVENWLKQLEEKERACT